MARLFCFLLAWLTGGVAFTATAQNEASLPALVAEPGDPERGLALIRDPSRASCLICHAISSLPDRDQGQLGPPLDGVGRVYDAGELRQRIVDARTMSPDTIMPPYHSTEGLYRVGEKWRGTTIYSAQDVEDVVAFLMSLKD